jgi:hypothetical protein
MKALKLLIAIILLPTTVAVTQTLYRLLIEQAQPSNTQILLSPLTLGFVSGLLLLLVLPRPTRTYVLGHELTHALWGILMGARVGKIDVSKKGGHVELSKTNFLISLAPYFFPFYTGLVIAIYFLASLFISVETYHTLFLSLVGITWAFHFHFTIQILMTRQPDITQNGRLFSYIVIYNLNIITLAIWLICMGPSTFSIGFDYLYNETLSSYQSSFEHIHYLIQKIQAYARIQQWKKIIP